VTDDAKRAIFDRVEKFRRRSARFDDDVITMAHGAGGKASEALLDAVFLDVFDDSGLHQRDDGAVLSPDSDSIVIATDSFVVSPWRFPGGSIGHLAVHGSVNDVAVMGATPRWLTVAFVIEEGFAVDDLREVVADMAAAAKVAGVTIVAGDTKVVERGAADGLYITTTGVGTRAADVLLGAEQVRVGDKVLISGLIGEHGMAIMLARGGLAFEADIQSDTASLSDMVAKVLAAAPGTRWLRDPTRGGVASALNELVSACDLAIELDEESLPVSPPTAGVCELLGLDPLYVANEGKAVAVVAPEDAALALEAMRAHPLGVDAAIIGEVVEDPPGLVVLRTVFGGTRIVDLLVGDPLPRIC
jgi:hydrogenase expression/formation protein HypE